MALPALRLDSLKIPVSLPQVANDRLTPGISARAQTGVGRYGVHNGRLLPDAVNFRNRPSADLDHRRLCGRRMVPRHYRFDLTSNKFRTGKVWGTDAQYFSIGVKSNLKPARSTNEVPARRYPLIF
jgi:hypothetical protein